MTKDLSCDVLIVGGGPAGLSVAATLPDDISVIIVHQDREIGKPVRTSGGSWLPDMERLGIPEQFYQVVDRADVYSDTVHAHFEINAVKMVVLDVTGLYKWLAKKSERPSRSLMLASKFLGTERRAPDDFVSEIRTPDGPVSIRSRYVVDASGQHAAVLESLGLGSKPDRYGVGIEYEYPIADNDPHRALLFVGSDALSGYGWVFPTTDGRIRVGIGIIHPDNTDSPRDLMAHFLASGSPARFGVTLDGEPLLKNAGVIPSVAYENDLVYGNVIRVGDSANFATPTVGEGIRICIELGELLGRELGRAIQIGSNKPLKSYEAACRKELAFNYRIGFLANKKISTYTPEDWDRSIRRLARLSEAEAVGLMRSEFTLRMALVALWKLLRRKFSRTK